MIDQAVIVQFTGYGEQFFKPGNRDLEPLARLQLEIEGTLAVEGTGVLDGHEIAIDGSEGTFYFYGPDARALFESIEEILDTSPITRGGTATLVFGDPADDDAPAEMVRLGLPA
ncbi:MAG: hypothetical protein JNM89_08095 [Hyphomicrobiaceae bacterium]|nr:hypothetical protein [Hyphomicrobiaceae bacterium]